ncbi:MAG: hypothetical protein ACJ0HH_02045 [Candidatus Thalassarchaeum sp.]
MGMKSQREAIIRFDGFYVPSGCDGGLDNIGNQTLGSKQFGGVT